MLQNNYVKAIFSVKLLSFLLILLSGKIAHQKIAVLEKTFTIMLDPAGDAQNTGRQIDNYFERGISLQCVEKLQDKLQKRFQNTKIAITRFAGETVQPLQNANFSNRFNVDFYISLHFYKEKEVRPNIYLYLFSYGDDFITKKHDLHFYPYDEAHLINIDTTKMYARRIQNLFQTDTYKKKFDFQGISKIPFKPLIGIKAPAIALEVGLHKKKDWKKYIDVFVTIIETIIQS